MTEKATSQSSVESLLRRTKIVATIGPASSSPEMIRQLIKAGMDVARLNFSHGSHEEHARQIATLRELSVELDTPVTILQDLQGPKIRVGQLSEDTMVFTPGDFVFFAPEADVGSRQGVVPIDYPHIAESAKPGMPVLIDDGLLELEVVEVVGRELRCRVIEGGVLKSRKGVNFPNLTLPLPSLTEKDIKDVEFGLAHGVDWISLSFVRSGADVRSLRELLSTHGAVKPIIAKIEKPQAVENLDEILREVNGVMVARGDLGVEVRAEKVPMLQKQIIEKCNRMGLPVITATQMLESMIRESRPTRAEASDVANAIIDGTDAIMLSGESAVGAYPVRAVGMMVRIATEVEASIAFKAYSATDPSDAHALSEGATAVAKLLNLRAIVVLTTSGYTARLVAAERSKTALFALTTDSNVYHALNLHWGIRPLLVEGTEQSFEDLVDKAETILRTRNLVSSGDKILIIGGVPPRKVRGSNFLKIHRVA
ncbi:MAG TPA: pyruvate kinase [Opitutaceae bacterium]|nr:pyruvate kinase [Opitutaceae bacterium]